MKPAIVTQATGAETFIAAVDAELQSRFRLDTQILFAQDYARAAYASGYAPAEFVAWLVKVDGLE